LWIDSHKGKIWHVSGHSHGSDPESQPDYPFNKRVDAGIENFGRIDLIRGIEEDYGQEASCSYRSPR